MPPLYGPRAWLCWMRYALNLRGPPFSMPEEPLLRDADDALRQREVGLEERAAVQDELAVRERLERLAGLHVRGREVHERGLLVLVERHEPVADSAVT